MEPFYIINKIPKINRAHWNLPWMSCILKFRSLKISLETLERSFHRGEKTKICREASWDIWHSPLWRNLSTAVHRLLRHSFVLTVACPVAKSALSLGCCSVWRNEMAAEEIITDKTIGPALQNYANSRGWIDARANEIRRELKQVRKDIFNTYREQESPKGDF